MKDEREMGKYTERNKHKREKERVCVCVREREEIEIKTQKRKSERTKQKKKIRKKVFRIEFGKQNVSRYVLIIKPMKRNARISNN
jgi:hypothetical protein